MTEKESPLPAQTELPDVHHIECMEIIGGNTGVRRALQSPGMDIWVDSRPIDAVAGGDIHYFSACGSGRVMRMVVADVSGHGAQSSDMATWLRDRMRKYINQLDQTKFAQSLNHEFKAEADDEYFATVLLVTYYSPTNHLLICNGGHPRPIRFSRRTGQWQILHQAAPHIGRSINTCRGTYALRPLANLPLGVIELTDYYQFSAQLDEGDMVVVYTDALIEAKSRDGVQLGQARLIELLERIGPREPKALSDAVLAEIDRWRGGAAADDDQTVIVMHHNASDVPRMTLRQATKSLAKMFGLIRM